jgi:hypothetical protein
MNNMIFREETTKAIIPRKIFSPRELANWPITLAEKARKMSEKIVHGS